MHEQLFPSDHLEAHRPLKIKRAASQGAMPGYLLLLVVSNTRFCARDLMPSTNNSCQQRLVLLLIPERDDHTHMHRGMSMYMTKT